MSTKLITIKELEETLNEMTQEELGHVILSADQQLKDKAKELRTRAFLPKEHQEQIEWDCAQKYGFKFYHGYWCKTITTATLVSKDEPVVLSSEIPQPIIKYIDNLNGTNKTKTSRRKTKVKA